MSLKQAVREALKGNDVDVHAKLTALRIECRERGIPSDEATRIVRSVIHENKQPAAMPEPPAPQQVTPTPPQAVSNFNGEQKLSTRVRFSGEPIKERKDSESMILAMADKKGR